MIDIKPFMRKTYSDQSYTCWDFVRDVYSFNKLGTLPDFTEYNHRAIPVRLKAIQDNIGMFKPCEYQEGALCLMRYKHNPIHIGICVGGNRIAHLDYERGVVIESVKELDIGGFWK